MFRSIRRGAVQVVAAALVVTPTFVVACNGAKNSVGPVAIDPDSLSSPRIVWGPAPAVFPAGAQMAVVQGDPSKAEPFIVRLRFPDGYKILPHTHPTDEHVTVISGSFKVGMGTTFDENAMVALPPGGFVTAPAQHAHYAKAKGATTVQVNAVGPFVLTYVNANGSAVQDKR